MSSFTYSPVLLQHLQDRHTRKEGTIVGAQSLPRAAADVKLVKKKKRMLHSQAMPYHWAKRKTAMEFWLQGNNSSTGVLGLHIKHLTFVSVFPARPLGPWGQRLSNLYL